ncbi:MAG TPA: hypothetical protein VGC47_03095 [Acidimicrobiia bacterium]|jgi:cell division septum initiation protein DivIVA
MIANLRAAIADLPVSARGIDPDALVTYADRLQGEIDEAMAVDRRRVSELERKLAEAREREEAIQLMFVAATKTKQELTEKGERQGQELIEAAKVEASRIVNAARSEAVGALNAARGEAEELVAAAGADVARLEAQRTDEERIYRTRLHAMAKSIETLEQHLRTITETALTSTAGLRREVATAIGDAPPAPPRQAAASVARPEPAASASPAPPAPPAEVHATAVTPPAEPAPVPVAEARPATATPETPARQVAAAYKARPATSVVQQIAERHGVDPTEVSPEHGDAPDEHDLGGTRIVVDTTGAERSEAMEDDREPKRGSFYTRRSAKLPHIGTDNNAMEVVGRMRTSRHRDSENDNDSPEEETEDLAYQHA